MVLHFIALRQMDDLLDGFWCQGMPLHRLKHGLIEIRDGHPQLVLTRSIHATTSADIFRHSATLPCAGLDDEPSTAQRTRRESRQQIVAAVLGRTPRDASTGKAQGRTLARRSSRLHALPQLLIDNAEMLRVCANPIGLWPRSLLHLAP